MTIAGTLPPRQEGLLILFKGAASLCARLRLSPAGGRAAMGDEVAQEEIVRFLEHGGLEERLERIETHGAFIFLGRALAWKMKQAVRFSFMDFSTLAHREAAIRAELELNRRTAPTLYRRVRAVTREPDGSLAVDGAGHPVEWLLEMNRFPADAQLDRVAARGELSDGHARELGDAIARFHEGAQLRPGYGGVAAMREVIDGNAGDLASLPPDIFASMAVTVLSLDTSVELCHQSNLLERRRRSGAVRRCHGDLHLANIVLLDGQPVLFDCLEFSEELASVDVLYDLAFLVMDLLERGLRARAWRVLQSYNDRRMEDEGLALLPLFLSMRAAIRAKVAGFTARRAEGRHLAAEERQQAATYLQLARSALEPARPMLIAVGGRSGTGKSTLAAALAPDLGAMPGAILLRSDVIRKRQAGLEPTERLSASAYRPEANERVYAEITTRTATLLRAGRTVICDAVYGREDERQAIERIARELRCAFYGLWLEAPESVLEERVTARVGDASDADRTVVRAQRTSVRSDAVTWHRIRADRPLAELANDARCRLELPCGGIAPTADHSRYRHGDTSP